MSFGYSKSTMSYGNARQSCDEQLQFNNLRMSGGTYNFVNVERHASAHWSSAPASAMSPNFGNHLHGQNMRELSRSVQSLPVARDQHQNYSGMNFDSRGTIPSQFHVQGPPKTPDINQQRVSFAQQHDNVHRYASLPLIPDVHMLNPNIQMSSSIKQEEFGSSDRHHPSPYSRGHKRRATNEQPTASMPAPKVQAISGGPHGRKIGNGLKTFSPDSPNFTLSESAKATIASSTNEELLDDALQLVEETSTPKDTLPDLQSWIDEFFVNFLEATF